MPEAGGRVGPEVIRAEELFLPLTNCSTQVSDLYVLPGQHSRAGPKGVDLGEVTAEQALSLTYCCKGCTSQGIAEELPLVVKTGSTGRLTISATT